MLSNFPKTVAQLDALDNYFTNQHLPKINRQLLKDNIPKSADTKQQDNFYAYYLNWLQNTQQVTQSNVIALWKALTITPSKVTSIEACEGEMLRYMPKIAKKPHHPVTCVSGFIGNASLSATLPPGAALSAKMTTAGGASARFTATGPTFFAAAASKHPAGETVPVVSHAAKSSIAARAAEIQTLLFRGQ